MATRTRMEREISEKMERKYGRIIAELESKISEFHETSEEACGRLAAAQVLLRKVFGHRDGDITDDLLGRERYVAAMYGECILENVLARLQTTSLLARRQ